MNILKQILKERDYYVFGLLLLSTFPLLDYGMITISIITYTLLCLLTWVKKGRPQVFSKKKIIVFLLCSGFYLMLFLSAFYSENSSTALKTVGKQVPLLIFPLTLFFISSSNHRLNLTYRNAILSLFAFSNFLIITFVFYLCLANPSYDLFVPGHVRRVMIDYGPLDLHPSYISLYSATSIIFLSSSFKNIKVNFWNILRLIAIPYFVLSLFLMSSKAIILALLITLPLLFLFSRKKSTFKFFLVSLAMIMTASVVYFTIPTIKARFETVYREFRLPNFQNPSTTPVRVGVYNCSYTLIKANYLLGYGIGDVQDQLDKCYLQYKTNIYGIREYNAHNYFLYLMLSAGIIALLLFVLAIGYQLYLSITRKDILCFSFLLIFVIFLLTENALVRAYGITYYCLFSTLCIMSNHNLRVK